MSEIKTLKVNTDKEREQWIDLLYHCVNFHESIAEEVKSDILGDEESKAMGIHTFKFTEEDIMRSELVKYLIKKFKNI